MSVKVSQNARILLVQKIAAILVRFLSSSTDFNVSLGFFFSLSTLNIRAW